MLCAWVTGCGDIWQLEPLALQGNGTHGRQEAQGFLLQHIQDSKGEGHDNMLHFITVIRACASEDMSTGALVFVGV